MDVHFPLCSWFEPRLSEMGVEDVALSLKTSKVGGVHFNSGQRVTGIHNTLYPAGHLAPGI